MLGADPPGGVATGEVVFNTVLSGYQEVITDPSYAGQIITFTYPHIGNCGTNRTDDESRRPFCRGVIVRDLARRHSNHRSENDLGSMLRGAGVPAIGGIDTRRLTRLIRDTGAMPGAFGTVGEADLLDAARAEPGTDGVDLVAQVTTDRPYMVETVDGDTVDGVDSDAWSTAAGGRSSSPTTSASSAPSCATSAHSPGSRWCRHRRPQPTSSPGGPTACSCRTGPATRRPCRTPSTRSAACSVRSRSSGSVSATSCSGWPSERARSSCRSDTTVATTRSRTS